MQHPYFELTRFEWHPDEPNHRYQVQLGQFGRRVCGDRCRRLPGDEGWNISRSPCQVAAMR